MLLVAVIAAVVFVIAARRLVDASLGDVTAKLIQPTGRPGARAAHLVLARAAVQVAVAALLLRHAKLLCRAVAAPKVVRLALSVVLGKKIFRYGGNVAGL